MNTESHICMGCLSGDRKLQTLNEECKQTFCGLLDIINNSPPISLCFECLALLLRIMSFKRQVKQAYTYLFSYLQDIPKSLSKLKITNNLIIYQIYEQNELDVIKNEDSFDQKTKEFDQNTDNTFDQKAIFDQNITEPLAFIKVEDGDDNDENTSIPDFKETFLDSDDEPLKVKSKVKHKKRVKDEKNKLNKRKKEQASGVVSDPRVAKKLKDLNIGEGHIALVLLTWDEVAEERRASLESPRYARHSHRCESCVVGYNHIHKLQQHNLKHSAEAGDEVCDVCMIRCKTRAALASHKRRHRARWVCQYCGARFSQACVAADHCTRAHQTAPAQHRCPHCTHIASSLGALRMHIKGHSSRPECTLCGKTFRDKSSLRTHAFVHKGEKEHACSVCDKKFMFKKQKEIHELTHKEHQHLYCHQCDVSFKNQTSYYQHMKYNLKHIDPADIKHACQLCDKRFVKAKRLEEHNLAVHLKLSPIKCTVPDCTFACPSRAALRSHIRLVHRGANSIRNHVCHLCGHTYKSKKSLDSHLRSHNTTLPSTQINTTNMLLGVLFVVAVAAGELDSQDLNPRFRSEDVPQEFSSQLPSNLDPKTLILDSQEPQYHASNGISEAARIKAAEDSPLSRIVGGLASYNGEHPFFGGLIITLTTGQTSVCGSSLLTSTKVLTTAHCWHDGVDTAYSIEVVLGSVRLFSGGTRVYASLVTAHGSYIPGVPTNDIALLTIPAVAFSSWVKSISIASGPADFTGYTAEAIGFGITSDFGQITQSASLRDVFVPVISNSVCRATYGNIVTPAVICTSGGGGRNPCGGDSGGPLILYSSAGNDVLIGVINFIPSAGCSSGLPGGYVRVSYHANWIISNA